MAHVSATANSLWWLRSLLEAYAGSELPDWDAFAAQIQHVRVAAGRTVFTVGDDGPHCLYVVQHGLVKGFARVDGRPAWFWEEGEVISPFPIVNAGAMKRIALNGVHPRSRGIHLGLDQLPVSRAVAVEPSQIFRIDVDVLDHLSGTHTAWSRLLYSIAFLRVATLYADTELLRVKPEERYRRVVVERPSLVRRITQRDLAGNLGITEEALSRIAKRIREE
ncbi:Crp/Fnr family transcriptional regulator [Propionicicella superfundia]|uniref:Crp/Fnr family transcriptional regulator n=1 Tax=Propionicicella superfundia TaxID=348582 RepID=UPI0004297BCD|nr:Crp/Fnr family transcriptional regulator [Propionicicella superfundia]